MYQRALIVDDSVPIHSLMKAHLNRDGLEFHSAYSGEAALTSAADIWPDVILLDVDLPGIDGFEVCRRLRSNTVTQSIPIIFVTADFCAKDKQKAIELGATGYITKPFKPDELVVCVDTSLRTKRLLEKQGKVDGLTGLWNQRYLEQNMSSELAMARDENRPVSCIVLDIDGLEQINRRHGFLFGDRLLRAVGNILLTQCREGDLISHMGGGQFAILLSNQTRAGAGRLAERLCGQVAKQLTYHDRKEVRLTCSFGVADCAISGDLPLIERAELALKRAKDNGGSCVSIARPPRAVQRAAA